MITSPEGDILKRLHKALTQEGDILPRRFLLIALGNMGGEGAQRILLREHAHKDRQHRAFAALGLALSNHGGSIPAFREALLAARDVSLRGVYATALGLLGDRGAVPVLADMLTKERNPEIQTHLIEALTLLRATAALPLVERLLRESRDPHVRVAAARAIGLLGSDEQGRQLVDLLASGSMTEDALGGLAMGIGLRRDPALAGPLLEVAGNASRSRLVRAFAITALGILADPVQPQGVPPSPFSRLTAGAHYGVRIDVLDALRALY
jgi:HEAT repeat protein